MEIQILKNGFWKLLLAGYLGVLSYSCLAQQAAVQGLVTDLSTQQPLPDVTVLVRQHNFATRTDSSGYFRFDLPPGEYYLAFSAVGYTSQVRAVMVRTQPVRLEVVLHKDIRQLDVVTITDKKPDQNVTAAQMGVVKLDVKNLKNIPVVFGEVDVLKALMLQPGVGTVGEGTSGFNVRGGRTDQNLVLLDGAPLFNTSHLLGFLSNINADLTQDVTLYKGHVPAAYGGRLSSLLQLTTLSGNTERVKLTTGLGLMTGSLLAEGPLSRDRRLTFVAGGRVAYPNFLIRRFPAPTNQNRAFFYDLNARLTYQLTPRTRLTTTFYHSYDTFKFPEDTLYGWRSTLATVKWSQWLAPQLSLHLTGTHSAYQFELEGIAPTNEYLFRSGIRQQDARADLLWTPHPAHRLEAGTTLTGYYVTPGSLHPTRTSSNLNPLALEAERARELAFYLSDEWTPLPWLALNAGLRYATFQNRGPGTAYRYLSGQPRSVETILDTLTYARGQTLATYGGWEPRLSARVTLSPRSSVKLSYTKMRQYLHLISNTTAISPVDFWKLSDPFVAPQVAEQWSVGYFRNLRDNTYETSLEVYYKDLTDLVEYQEGATLLLNPALEADLLPARGRAYGLEVSIQKSKGLLTGQLSYTYSRTFARAVTPFVSEQINQGRWYAATFDRPHNLALSTQWKWPRGWTFGANFVYTSGRPTTYPDGTYRLNDVVVLDYSQRNADRLPDYHRLDVAFTKDTRRQPEQERYTTWSFSLYNLYARKNPYSIYFRQEGLSTRSYRLSVFGTIIPSLSWKRTF
ncbi:TonB-dependent receptor [Rhabdobacter roseus]|uniref:TonB-dependent receptor plug domain-containing protein n=1 Tax=Rhabdobacter roseus TaxID=1655419 RepID=A0A840TZ32_9BACT|nr:TonB-dependent receptor [Rhabdobacter roseus]MBB5284889.1 hypothetical protein [Rhabdobacter roseus]